jgi:hypothetical protein
VKHRAPVLAVCCFAVLIASLPSYPYNIGEQEVTVNVQFPFTAGDRSLPAGFYKLEHVIGPFPEIRITTADGITIVPVLAVTRLARLHMADAPKASVVFDKVGNRYFLSEVWLPGLDGFLLRATKEKHEHEIVNLSH